MMYASKNTHYIQIYIVTAVVLQFLFLSPFAHAGTSTSTPTVTVINLQCDDGIDNDGDGDTDFPNDPGCTGPGDNDETNPQCNDGLDNDNDDLVDFPNDPGCSSLEDDSEASGGGGGFLPPIFRAPPTAPTTTPPVAGLVVFTGQSHSNGTVVLLIDGVIAATTGADGEGQFTITLQNLSSGAYLFSLYGFDTSSVRSGILAFYVDITESAQTNISQIFIPPTLELSPDSTTAIAAVTISGFSVPGSLIGATVIDELGREQVFTARADSKGKYSSRVPLNVFKEGKYIAKPLAAAAGVDSPFGEALAFRIIDGRILIGPISRLVGDFNKDSKVNLIDFSMIAFWYKRDNPPSRFDLNDDGAISLADFSIMAFYWTG